MSQLIITSPAFQNEAVIPELYTGRGADISPELRLSQIDEKAKSLAVIMDDLGHPIPEFNHWVIWNIPVLQTIPAGIPHGAHVLNGATQGRGYGKNRYRGPKPPFNWSHRYRYSVYVLDTLLSLPETARKRDLLITIQGHILQEGHLMGRFR